MVVKKTPEETQAYIQHMLGELRKEKEITQEELADKIGLTSKTISDIENNRRGVSIESLIKICNELNIDLLGVFENEDK